MYEMMFRAQHNYPFTELTKNQPKAKFAHWCNLKTDILEVDCPDAQTLEEVQKDLARL